MKSTKKMDNTDNIHNIYYDSEFSNNFLTKFSEDFKNDSLDLNKEMCYGSIGIFSSNYPYIRSGLSEDYLARHIVVKDGIHKDIEYIDIIEDNKYQYMFIKPERFIDDILNGVSYSLNVLKFYNNNTDNVYYISPQLSTVLSHITKDKDMLSRILIEFMSSYNSVNVSGWYNNFIDVVIFLMDMIFIDDAFDLTLFERDLKNIVNFDDERKLSENDDMMRKEMLYKYILTKFDLQSYFYCKDKNIPLNLGYNSFYMCEKYDDYKRDLIHKLEQVENANKMIL